MPDYPVAIDGRNDLYGDDLDRLFYDTEMGRDSYATDPYLDGAGVVLLQKSEPLAGLLLSDPRRDKPRSDRITAYSRRLNALPQTIGGDNLDNSHQKSGGHLAVEGGAGVHLACLHPCREPLFTLGAGAVGQTFGAHRAA